MHSRSGYGGYGRLGHGDEKSHLKPKLVKTLAGDFIVEVVCGWYHTIAITSKGLIYTWGSTTNGRAGSEDKSPMSPFHSCILKPKLLRNLSRKFVVFVSAHRDHTVCVTKHGEVYSWGEGKYGKLGHGNDSNQFNPKLVEALVGTQIKEASCGRHHTAVRTNDGKVLTFGKRVHGHLDELNEFVPSLVRPLEGKIITQLQCGDDCVVALTFTGYVYILRIDGSGEEEPLSVPLLVKRLSAHNVVQIATYSEHCAALVNPNPSVFRQHQRAQLNNKKHSDVAFIVENQPIYANIAVLTRKSQYFQAMFRSKMRESIERIVHIPNCSRTAFLKLMEYFYLDGFSVTEEDAVMLFYLSDMYLLDELRMICTSTIENAMLPD
jgi:alpha-tubulin suppressor-like RCC1 family protein